MRVGVLGTPRMHVGVLGTPQDAWRCTRNTPGCMWWTRNNWDSCLRHGCVCRGDFRVAYNPDGDTDKNSLIFHLLEQACIEMADVSYKIQISRSSSAEKLPNGFRPLYKNFVYSRMLWCKSVGVASCGCSHIGDESGRGRVKKMWRGRWEKKMVG